MPGKFLKESEAAQRIGLQVDELRALREAGDAPIKPQGVGRTHGEPIYTREDVLAYLDQFCSEDEAAHVLGITAWRLTQLCRKNPPAIAHRVVPVSRPGSPKNFGMRFRRGHVVAYKNKSKARENLAGKRNAAAGNAKPSHEPPPATTPTYVELEQRLAKSEQELSRLRETVTDLWRVVTDACRRIPKADSRASSKERRPRECWRVCWELEHEVREDTPALREAPIKLVHRELLARKKADPIKYKAIPEKYSTMEHYHCRQANLLRGQVATKINSIPSDPR